MVYLLRLGAKNVLLRMTFQRDQFEAVRIGPLGPSDRANFEQCGIPADLFIDGFLDLRDIAALGWIVTRSGFSRSESEGEDASADRQLLKESKAFWDSNRRSA